MDVAAKSRSYFTWRGKFGSAVPFLLPLATLLCSMEIHSQHFGKLVDCVSTRKFSVIALKDLTVSEEQIHLIVTHKGSDWELRPSQI
jgi:hypothetical protein